MGILLSWIVLMNIFQFMPIYIDEARVYAAAQSGDNSLSSLSISPGTLSPAFQYNVVDYTATVGEDVTSVEINAQPSNETATIESVSGNTDLQVGENTVSIVVKAQNGTAATYKIVVTRGGTQEGAAGDAADTTAQEPQTDGTEGGITLNGHPFNLAPTIPEDVVPQDFTKTTVTCQGQQVEGLTFDKAELTLVYLTTPSTDVKNTLAVYEGEEFYPFRKVQLDEANYLIILNPPKETGLSSEYAQTEQTVGEFANVPAYAKGGNPSQTEDAHEGNEAGEDSSDGGFSLIYGASSYGNKGWYQYDAKESTIQRYNPLETAASQIVPVTQPEDSLEPSAEMQSLQKAYTDMEEQYNNQKDSSRKTIAVLVFIIAVLLVVVVNLLLRGRKGEEDLLEEDVDYDDLSEKVRRQVKSARKSRREQEGRGGRITEDAESELWEDDTESGAVLKQRTKIIPEIGADIAQPKGAGVKGAKAGKNTGHNQPRTEQVPDRRQLRAEQKTDRKQLGVESRADRKQPVAEPKADRKQPRAEQKTDRKPPRAEQKTDRKPPRAEQKTDRKLQTRIEKRPEPRTALDEDFEVIDLEDL